jgi:hypothetical protein
MTPSPSRPHPEFLVLEPALGGLHNPLCGLQSFSLPFRRIALLVVPVAPIRIYTFIPHSTRIPPHIATFP